MRTTILLSFLLLIACNLAFARSRPARRITRALTETCDTNAECLQKGLPLRKLRRPRAVSSTPVVLDRDCQTNTPQAALRSKVLDPGSYTFTLNGANGGDNARQGYTFPQFYGGRGGEIVATYNFTQARTIYYKVGCSGGGFVGAPSSGGGASFITIDDLSTPLLVAGGGGGSGSKNSGLDAGTTYTFPLASTGGTSSGGAGGGGGAGFFADGDFQTAQGNTGLGGKSLASGGEGGVGGYNNNNKGGIGGGGGGGYNGIGQDLDNTKPAAGGGGGAGYNGGSGGAPVAGQTGGAPGTSYYSESSAVGFSGAIYRRNTRFGIHGSISYVQKA